MWPTTGCKVTKRQTDTDRKPGGRGGDLNGWQFLKCDMPELSLKMESSSAGCALHVSAALRAACILANLSSLPAKIGNTRVAVNRLAYAQCR